MNRKYFPLIVFIASFFIITLGVRMPDVKKDPRPKSRPRAVIENIVKMTANFSTVKQVDAEPYQHILISYCTTHDALHIKELHSSSLFPLFSFPQRASPTTLS